MTDLDLADASMAGLVAWYSLIHVPDDEIGAVFTHFPLPASVAAPGDVLWPPAATPACVITGAGAGIRGERPT